MSSPQLKVRASELQNKKRNLLNAERDELSLELLELLDELVALLVLELAGADLEPTPPSSLACKCTALCECFPQVNCRVPDTRANLGGQS
jgi:hypothetical protein